MAASLGRNLLPVHARPGRPTEGIIRTPAGPIACALGRSGIRHGKREGDGATPAAPLRPVAVLYRPDRVRPPMTALPLAAIRETDGWCDDPRDRNYNRAVKLPYPASHERLFREDHLYDVVIVLDWNMDPSVPGRGSAIFLHIARPGYAPTEGCLAVAPADMQRLLRMIDEETVFDIG